MAHDVFISYASGDKAVADAVCATLESHGVRCWIAPRDVMPSTPYGEAIINAIHGCRIMILVFSSKANLSPHIPKEVERAVSKGVPILPVRIEDVAPGLALDYFIGSVHWLDALTPPLERHLERLAQNVQTLLSQNATIIEPETPRPASGHAPSSVPASTQGVGAPSQSSSRRRKLRIAGLCVVGLLLVAALAYVLLSGHTLSNHTRQEFYSASFSADGKWLATGDSGGNVELWNVPSGKHVRSVVVRRGEAHVAFSPDSKRLATGDSGGGVSVWNVETGEKLQDNFLYGSAIRSVAYSPDGKWLVAMGSTVNSNKSDSVKVWFLDAVSLQLTRTVDTHTGVGAYLGSLTFTVDGRWLALGLDDLLLMNASNGEIHKLESVPMMGWGYSVSFSPNGQKLASAGADLRLWDVASGRLLRTLRGFTRYMTYSAAFSPDGRWLASGSNKLDLWNLETGTKTEILDNCAKHEVNCAVLSVAFSPNGNWLASGTQEGSLQLWNMRAIRMKNLFR